MQFVKMTMQPIDYSWYIFFNSEIFHQTKDVL